MAKKVVKRQFVIGQEGADYIYDSTFGTVKEAQNSAVDLVLEGGEDNIVVYELVPVKTVKITVDIKEVA